MTEENIFLKAAKAMGLSLDNEEPPNWKLDAVICRSGQAPTNVTVVCEIRHGSNWVDDKWEPDWSRPYAYIVKGGSTGYESAPLFDLVEDARNFDQPLREDGTPNPLHRGSAIPGVLGWSACAGGGGWPTLVVRCASIEDVLGPVVDRMKEEAK